MAATLTVQFGVIKNALTSYVRGVHYSNTGQQRPTIAAEGRYYATTGIPITADGRNECEDVTLAAKNALLSMIEYLTLRYRFTREQAYALTSVAVDLHLSELVDVPNVLVSAFLPLEIFET